MALSCEDRMAISELLALYGHLCDSGELDRLHEVFTIDVTYDVTALGGGVLEGTAACAEAGRALGDANPVGHHVTNIVLTEDGAGRVRALSKGIGVNADGTAGSVTYDDTVVRVRGHWRIGHRKVSLRRTPLVA
ncbi:nuclear transport factor 2 family protein [Actinomadura sp. WMMB 499]|uniref:nuclear transport factor 2 family protein n=1 Tax=Actinomadura sp. WMMB 499 TaxID=1219491 RepID=UPI0012469C3F|nr:nuclear transport factor 2 family protein [Actinomadura sp. WMMB 499]QFG20361.1 nuclear transport factor 2 family protein [Actinomadura sp. WMMB 499]